MSEPLWARRDLSATVLFGISEGGPMSILFAATYPERTLALILAGAFARRAWPPDYPWGVRSEEIQKLIDECQRKWRGPVGMPQWAPSLPHDKHFMDWWDGSAGLVAPTLGSVGA